MIQTFLQPVSVNHYLVISALLFSLGMLGVFFNRKYIISMLMSIELMLLSVNLNFVAFSKALNDLYGQVFTLFILTVAAAEAAIGLAIMVLYYRNRQTLEIDTLTQLKDD